METLRVNTIYPAFMGECNVHGIGVPCTFVRLAGCNLRCYESTKGILCDTPEALGYSCGSDMSPSQILHKVISIGRKVVCLTGGEPLTRDVTKLLTLLSAEGFSVVIETNGSQSIEPYLYIKNISFVVDVKTTSSGEAEKMLEGNYRLMGKDDFVKFVIDNEADLQDFHNWMTSHSYYKGNVAVGLFWGSKMNYRTLINYLNTYRGVFLNMQTHKMACLYDVCEEDTFKELSIPKDL